MACMQGCFGGIGLRICWYHGNSARRSGIHQVALPKAPIANIIFGTMTLGYRGYGARVHDAATAEAMLGTFLESGHDQIDTCHGYGDGSCEQMLGDLLSDEGSQVPRHFTA